MGRVRSGREPVAEIEGPLAGVVEGEAWDGGDGATEAEEEFSLEDIMGEL